MKKGLIVLSALAILASCGTQQSTSDNQNATADSIVKAEEKNIIIDNNTKYKLPSPVELYILIKEAKAKYTPEALHDITKSSKYITSDAKAINFGIYASDLAYCTVFEKQQETHNLFKTIKTMGVELGISEGFNASIVERIDKNLYNSDSLYQITNDSYWEVCNSLEEQGNANILSKILLGGWVESLHLAIQSVEKFDTSSELVLRITEQSYLLENLIDYISSLAKDDSNDELLQRLLDLQYSFDKLYDNSEDVLITPEQYKEIAQKVDNFRNQLIK